MGEVIEKVQEPDLTRLEVMKLLASGWQLNEYPLKPERDRWVLVSGDRSVSQPIGHELASELTLSGSLWTYGWSQVTETSGITTRYWRPRQYRVLSNG